MKLLTPEEGLQLKAGDVVNMYSVTPRQPKGGDFGSLEWDGRQVWLDRIWRNEVVEAPPYCNTHEVEGPLVKLVGRMPGFSVKLMELVSS